MEEILIAVIPVMPRAYPGYQVAMALIIKEKTQLPILAGGLVTEPAQALQLLKTGIDLVYTGRELLCNPTGLCYSSKWSGLSLICEGNGKIR